MTRRLLAASLGLTIVVLLVLVVPLGLSFADRERDDLLARVERDTVAIALELAQPRRDLLALPRGVRHDLPQLAEHVDRVPRRDVRLLHRHERSRRCDRLGERRVVKRLLRGNVHDRSARIDRDAPGFVFDEERDVAG